MKTKFLVRLVDNSGKFRVPTVFVTNAGNTLRKKKAEQLSTWLGVEIEEDQVFILESIGSVPELPRFELFDT